MPTSARTTFDPRVHGFHFDNSFSTTVWDAVTVGPVRIPSLRLGGLCGGMTFAALDNYFASRPAPATTLGTIPEPGSELHQRIYRRHLASVGLTPTSLGVPIPHSTVKVIPGHLENLLRYPYLRAAPAALRRRENRIALASARRWLLEGYPIALGLVSPDTLTDSHQVVAYGFDDGVHATVLHLYDCRSPDETAHLTVGANGDSCELTAPGRPTETWRAFFVSHYDPHPKPAAHPLEVAAAPVERLS